MNDQSQNLNIETTDPLEIPVTLSSLVGTREALHLETSLATHPTLNGYLLGLSDELGLMHAFDDFHPDGYTLFPVSCVTRIRSGDYERKWDSIVQAEGLLAGVDQVLQIELNNLQSAILSVDRQFSWMILEACLPDGEEEFSIGQLISINADEVLFDHFDPLGHWSEEPAEIPLPEIEVVQFETDYLRTFRKYLSRPRPSRRS